MYQTLAINSIKKVIVLNKACTNAHLFLIVLFLFKIGLIPINLKITEFNWLVGELMNEKIA